MKYELYFNKAIIKVISILNYFKSFYVILEFRITLHTNMLINSLYSILEKVKMKHKEKYRRLLWTFIFHFKIELISFHLSKRTYLKISWSR